MVYVKYFSILFLLTSGQWLLIFLCCAKTFLLTQLLKIE